MESKKSSSVRTSLSQHLSEVAQSGNAVGIEHNGDVVAILTTEKPSYAVPSLQLRTAEAKIGWAKILEAVAVRSARFYFHRKGEPRIYLVKNKDYSHQYGQMWVKHLAEWRAQQQQQQQKEKISMSDLLDAQDDVQDTLRELGEEVGKISQKINSVFAIINRGGSLLSTPESGLVTLSSSNELERIERD